MSKYSEAKKYHPEEERGKAFHLRTLYSLFRMKNCNEVRWRCLEMCCFQFPNKMMRSHLYLIAGASGQFQCPSRGALGWQVEVECWRRTFAQWWAHNLTNRHISLFVVHEVGVSLHLWSPKAWPFLCFWLLCSCVVWVQWHHEQASLVLKDVGEEVVIERTHPDQFVVAAEGSLEWSLKECTKFSFCWQRNSAAGFFMSATLSALFVSLLRKRFYLPQWALPLLKFWHKGSAGQTLSRLIYPLGNLYSTRCSWKC